MKRVTNISKDRHLLWDKGGKRIELEPNMTTFMIHPPIDAFPFKVEEITHVEKTEEPEKKQTERRKKLR